MELTMHCERCFQTTLSPANQPATLRDRLDALHSSAQERDAEVIDLSSTLVRPQRGRNI
jgi:hypothetical protein